MNDHPRDLSQAANRAVAWCRVGIAASRRARLLLVTLVTVLACAPEFTGSPASSERGGAPGNTGSGGEQAFGGSEAGQSSEAGQRSEGGRDGGGDGEAGDGTAESGGALGEGGSGGSPDDTCGITGRSCRDLPRACGADGKADCCSSGLVAAGSFHRSHEAIRPATLSAFRLDVYEVTVGRFRKFVDAYPASKPVAGCGKNPNNAADPGWESAWDSSLPATAEGLRTALACAERASWSDSPGNAETLPMNCLTWYEAYAFCVWDGGRLPTEAEWNYAAAGGAEQRPYPWSSSANDESIDGTYATYCSSSPCVVRPVGSRSLKGDGKWGQADLAGSVREWVQDYYLTYSSECIDCAALTGGSTRVRRGGSYADSPAFLFTAYREAVTPAQRVPNAGVRCARSP